VRLCAFTKLPVTTIIGEVSNVPVRIIVMAASAGGIEALRVILRTLPASLAVPIAIVQHRAAEPSGNLARTLSGATALHLKDAEDGEVLAAGTVYLAPAGCHFIVDDCGFARLIDGPKVRFARPSADVLFGSAANAFGAAVLAVVLTGGDGDGAAGSRQVRAAGGIVIAQDRETSQVFSMPAATIAAGAASFILPLAEIGPKMLELVAPGNEA